MLLLLGEIGHVRWIHCGNIGQAAGPGAWVDSLAHRSTTEGC